MKLRPYQQSAIDALYHHLRQQDSNPCLVIPTGGGKTPVMSTICMDAVKQWSGRVLILAHVKELLEQTANTISRVAPDLEVGVYSAGLKRRDTSQAVIVAGIQSVYKKACELDAFDLIIVDEAHLLPPEGEGMYQAFLKDAQTINPHVRLIGLTATPYRLKSGSLCGPDSLLNEICYEIGVKELINQGYLCPLKTKAGNSKADTSSLHVRAGEFISSEVEQLMDTDLLVRGACREIIQLSEDRTAVLIFAALVSHAEHVQSMLQKMSGQEVGLITGETSPQERNTLLARFKGEPVARDLFGTFEPPLKYLVNINVLTTGFDAPNVDCVVLLRPTASPGLYYQMVGRGFRLHEEKSDCLVLDYGGNILRHGPVDAIVLADAKSTNQEAPAKECPKCHTVVHAAYSSCPDCGFEFPIVEREKQSHQSQASDAGIISGQVHKHEYSVSEVYYSVHQKRGAEEDAPKTMRVDYRISLEEWHSEWICIEHDGYAQKKAIAWWQLRSQEPFPNSAQEAVLIADQGGLAPTTEITVRSVTGEAFDRIVAYRLGEIPNANVQYDAMEYDESEIPF